MLEAGLGDCTKQVHQPLQQVSQGFKPAVHNGKVPNCNRGKDVNISPCFKHWIACIKCDHRRALHLVTFLWVLTCPCRYCVGNKPGTPPPVRSIVVL